MPKKKQIDYAAMFTLRKDGRYMGYWYDSEGKRHAIYDRDPERLYRKIEDKETPSRTTFGEVIDAWSEKHREEIRRGTWANYKSHVDDIKSLYGSTPVDEVTALMVTQDLLSQKAKGYSYTVVNSRRCIWRMALDHAVADPEIRLPYNPALAVKNPKGLHKGKRGAPPDEVISEILSDAGSVDVGFIAFFLLCTGLRRTEALQRLKSDIDTKSWEISIPTAKTAAGIRTVPIIAPLRAPLRAWMDAHPGDYLFPHIDYAHGRKASAGYMSPKNWENAWLAYCKEKGWVNEKGNPSVGAHHFRHGTATLLYEANVDILTAQSILGHANVETTIAIYTELRKKQKNKNVSKFSRVLSKLLSKTSNPLQ